MHHRSRHVSTPTGQKRSSNQWAADVSTTQSIASQQSCGVRPMSIGRCGPVAFQLRSGQGPDLQWRNGAARGAVLNTEGIEGTEFKGETKGTQPWWCHDRWWRFRVCSCCSSSVSLSRHDLLPERQGPLGSRPTAGLCNGLAVRSETDPVKSAGPAANSTRGHKLHPLSGLTGPAN